MVTINGAPGLLMEIGGGPSVITMTIDNRRITTVNVMRNPEKLTTIAR